MEKQDNRHRKNVPADCGPSTRLVLLQISVSIGSHVEVVGVVGVRRERHPWKLVISRSQSMSPFLPLYFIPGLSGRVLSATPQVGSGGARSDRAPRPQVYSYHDLKSLVNESVAVYQAGVSAGSTEMHALMRGCRDLLGVAPAAEVPPQLKPPNIQLRQIQLDIHSQPLARTFGASVGHVGLVFLHHGIQAVVDLPTHTDTARCAPPWRPAHIA